MTKEARIWMRTAAILAGLSVALGAFAAHGLDQTLLRLYEGQTKTVAGVEIPATQKYLADFKTAAEYQMYHALGILAVSLLPDFERSRNASRAAWAFLLGILLFSGSLYVLVLTGITRLGMITPFGGVFFLIGWMALVFAVSETIPATQSESDAAA